MSTIVERCELAPDLSVSRVITGLWQIADMERDGQSFDLSASAKAIEPYLGAGLTSFDMADHYGSAELIIGQGSTARRGKKNTQALTKWVPTPGPVTPQVVRNAVQRSLDRLKTDVIELMQFHAWNYADPAWLDCLLELQELQTQGIIRHLGLTNFDSAHLGIVINSGIKVVSNQVCFSLIDQRPLHTMTALCQASGVKLLAYGTLAGGFLTEHWLGKSQPKLADLSTWSQMKYFRFVQAGCGWDGLQSILATADAIAKKHQVTLANVAGRYIIEQQSVGAIIIGAQLGKRDHIENNLRLFQFELDAEDHAQFRTLSAQLAPLPGDCGDEYRRPPYLTAAGDLSDHFPEQTSPYAKQQGSDGRDRVSSGTIWEDIAGFSRAVRAGDRILVSGTTATHGNRAIGGDDVAAQLHFIIDKIEGALQSLGGSLEDVVRTRIYLAKQDDWEVVSRVHGQRFGHIRPANTLVQAGLIGDEYLVEMEAEAICQA